MPGSASSASLPKRNAKLAAKNNTTLLLPSTILLLVVAVDQLSKWWALSRLSDHQPVEVLGNFLKLTLVYNLGGAMGTSLGTPTYYLVVALIILPFILYYMWLHRDSRAVSVPLAFIAGGAIGNIIDRIRLGRVIDFIDMDFFDIRIGDYQLERWWTFNIADAAILCAMIFLVGYLIFHRPEKTSAVDSPGKASR